jgi:hypothetical protein
MGSPSSTFWLSDETLDAMCRKQTLMGLPLAPPPRYAYACPICALGKMIQVRKGKKMDTTDILPGELLYIDFAFWGIFSRRGFTIMLVAIYSNTRKLWRLCTASKKPPCPHPSVDLLKYPS